MAADYCRKCGLHVSALNPGIHLSRVNAKGVLGIMECKPACYHTGGTFQSALLDALDANEPNNTSEE